MPGEDTRRDVGPDAGTDAVPDAGTDGVPDGRPDAGQAAGSDTWADTLLALHAAGVEAVGGRQTVRRALADIDCGPAVRVAALGKAASAMALGARESLGDTLRSGLVLTKYAHLEPDLVADARFVCRESAHPVPDEASLEAGEALVDFVRAVADDEHLLVLVSGGASALVEQLVDGMTLEDLRQRTDALLADGAAIGEINRVRRSVSAIKGGGMLAHLGECRVTQLLISDVPGDRPGDIGSGPFVADAADGGCAGETEATAKNGHERAADCVICRAARHRRCGHARHRTPGVIEEGALAGILAEAAALRIDVGQCARGVFAGRHPGMIGDLA